MRKKIISSIEVFIVVSRVSPSCLSLQAFEIRFFSFGYRNALHVVNNDASKVFLVQGRSKMIAIQGCFNLSENDLRRFTKMKIVSSQYEQLRSAKISSML